MPSVIYNVVWSNHCWCYCCSLCHRCVL